MRKREKGKNRLWLLTVIVIVMTGLLLAGCGSSSDSDNAGSYDTASDSAGSEEMLKSDQFGAAESPASEPAADTSVKVTAASSESPAAEEPAATAENDSAVPPRMSEPGNTVLGALDRKLIYQAQVTMEVADYGKAQTELFNLVTMSRGYMLNFNDTQSKYELGGVFVIKLPSTGFQSFLAQLEKLKKGDTFQRNVQGQDVTEEYVDLNSRLKAKQVVEARLLNFMEKATDTKNLLQFSNELARVQEEIETIKGRMRYIDQNVAYSTIELRMYEKLENVKNQEEDPEKRNAFLRAGSAMKGSADAIVSFFEGLLIVLAGALPILFVMALAVVPLLIAYRRMRYRNGKTIANQPASTGQYATVVQTEPEPKPGSDDEEK